MSETDDKNTGQMIAAAAEVYDEFFVPSLFGQWPDRILDAAGVEGGDRVLDVGCGTGIVAQAAVDRVGRDGAVVGIDPNEGMLGVARRSPLPIDWTQGVAEQLPFDDDEFDRTVSQFAAMFFEDRHVAVAEMARVTRPGGTVTLATWASIDQSPGYAAMLALLDRLLGPKASAALMAPFVLGEEEMVADLLTPVLSDVALARLDGTARFASIESWVRTEVRGWTLAGSIGDEDYVRLLDVARRESDRFSAPDGRIEFSAPAIIGTGNVV